MANTALLLIDLQRDFLEKGGRLPVGEENALRVIAASNLMLELARKTGWKLIFVKNEFSKSDWIGNFFRNNAAIKGSAGAQIDPRVSVPAEASILPKAKPDAFSNPALEATLQAGSIQRIVMLGVMTEACVCSTAQSAINRGFEAILVSDAVASSEENLHRAGLANMRKAGVQIKESQDMLQSP